MEELDNSLKKINNLTTENGQLQIKIFQFEENQKINFGFKEKLITQEINYNETKDQHILSREFVKKTKLN